MATEIICVVFLLILLFFAGLIGIILFRKFYLGSKVPQYCQDHGLTYYGSDAPHAWEMIEGSALDYGDRQSVTWGIGQKVGSYEVITFQYTVTVERTDSDGKRETDTYPYCVALFQFPFREGGSLYMRREGFFDKVKAFFGRNDLDFENKEFSDRYHVSASPPQFAYKFFHPRMIELFLKYRSYNLVVKRGIVMIYQDGSIMSMTPVLDLWRGQSPFGDWMYSSKNMLMHIENNIPKLLRQRVAIAEEEEEVVLAELADEPKSLGLVCPNCSHEFEVAQGQKLAKCPKCSTVGEL